MTDADDLAWGTVTPRRCRRHVYDYGDSRCSVTKVHPVHCEEHTQCPTVDYCMRCKQPRDIAASRRGRTNRQRGNAIERDVAKQLGLRRVGQYGGPEDVSGDAFVVQVKSTSPNKVTGRYAGWFSDRVWNELKRLPANAGQTPLLVVTDAPGPGHKRRAVVMLTLEDWISLHGQL